MVENPKNRDTGKGPQENEIKRRGLSKAWYAARAAACWATDFHKNPLSHGKSMESGTFENFTDKTYDLRSASYVLEQRERYENQILDCRLNELLLEKKISLESPGKKQLQQLSGLWRRHVWRKILERSEASCRQSIKDKLDRYSKQHPDDSLQTTIYEANKETMRSWERLDNVTLTNFEKQITGKENPPLKEFEEAVNTFKTYVKHKSRYVHLQMGNKIDQALGREIDKDKESKRLGEIQALLKDPGKRCENWLTTNDNRSAVDKWTDFNHSEVSVFNPLTWIDMYPNMAVRHPLRASIVHLLGTTVGTAVGVGLVAGALGIGIGTYQIWGPFVTGFLGYREYQRMKQEKEGTGPNVIGPKQSSVENPLVVQTSEREAERHEVDPNAQGPEQHKVDPNAQGPEQHKVDPETDLEKKRKAVEIANAKFNAINAPLKKARRGLKECNKSVEATEKALKDAIEEMRTTKVAYDNNNQAVKDAEATRAQATEAANKAYNDNQAVKDAEATRTQATEAANKAYNDNQAVKDAEATRTQAIEAANKAYNDNQAVKDAEATRAQAIEAANKAYNDNQAVKDAEATRTQATEAANKAYNDNQAVKDTEATRTQATEAANKAYNDNQAVKDAEATRTQATEAANKAYNDNQAVKDAEATRVQAIEAANKAYNDNQAVKDAEATRTQATEAANKAYNDNQAVKDAEATRTQATEAANKAYNDNQAVKDAEATRTQATEAANKAYNDNQAVKDAEATRTQATEAANKAYNDNQAVKDAEATRTQATEAANKAYNDNQAVKDAEATRTQATEAANKAYNDNQAVKDAEATRTQATEAANKAYNDNQAVKDAEATRVQAIEAANKAYNDNQAVKDAEATRAQATEAANKAYNDNQAVKDAEAIQTAYDQAVEKAKFAQTAYDQAVEKAKSVQTAYDTIYKKYVDAEKILEEALKDFEIAEKAASYNALLQEIKNLPLPPTEVLFDNLETFQKPLKKEIETTLKYLPLANTWKTQYKPWFNNFEGIPLTDEARISLQDIGTNLDDFNQNQLVKWLSEKASTYKQLASKLASSFNTPEAANEFSNRLKALNKPLEIIDTLNKDGIPVTKKPDTINGSKVVTTTTDANKEKSLIYSLIAINNPGLLESKENNITWKDGTKGALGAMVEFIASQDSVKNAGEKRLDAIKAILQKLNCANDKNDHVVYKYIANTDGTTGGRILPPSLDKIPATYNALLNSDGLFEAMVNESEINSNQDVMSGWNDKIMAAYNNVGGDKSNELNAAQQKQFNKKLEELLTPPEENEQKGGDRKDGKQDKPGQRSPSDDSTTWWDWKAPGWKDAITNFFKALGECFGRLNRKNNADQITKNLENLIDPHDWFGKSSTSEDKNNVPLFLLYIGCITDLKGSKSIREYFDVNKLNIANNAKGQKYIQKYLESQDVMITPAIVKSDNQTSAQFIHFVEEMPKNLFDLSRIAIQKRIDDTQNPAPDGLKEVLNEMLKIRIGAYFKNWANNRSWVKNDKEPTLLTNVYLECIKALQEIKDENPNEKITKNADKALSVNIDESGKVTNAAFTTPRQFGSTIIEMMRDHLEQKMINDGEGFLKALNDEQKEQLLDVISAEISHRPNAERLTKIRSVLGGDINDAYCEFFKGLDDSDYTTFLNGIESANNACKDALKNISKEDRKDLNKLKNNKEIIKHLRDLATKQPELFKDALSRAIGRTRELYWFYEDFKSCYSLDDEWLIKGICSKLKISKDQFDKEKFNQAFDEFKENLDNIFKKDKFFKDSFSKKIILDNSINTPDIVRDLAYDVKKIVQHFEKFVQVNTILDRLQEKVGSRIPFSTNPENMIINGRQWSNTSGTGYNCLPNALQMMLKSNLTTEDKQNIENNSQVLRTRIVTKLELKAKQEAGTELNEAKKTINDSQLDNSIKTAFVTALDNSKIYDIINAKIGSYTIAEPDMKEKEEDTLLSTTKAEIENKLKDLLSTNEQYKELLSTNEQYKELLSTIVNHFESVIKILMRKQVASQNKFLGIEDYDGTALREILVDDGMMKSNDVLLVYHLDKDNITCKRYRNPDNTLPEDGNTYAIFLQGQHHFSAMVKLSDIPVEIRKLETTKQAQIKDKILIHGKNHTPPLEVTDLQNAGLLPQHQIKIDNTDFLISPIFKEKNRAAAIVYVKKDDQYIARTFYCSQSQGIWRYLPGYYDNWYDKGFGEESLMAPIQLQRALIEIQNAQQNLHTSDKLTFCFAGTAKNYTKGTYYKEINPNSHILGIPRATDDKTKYSPEQLNITKDNEKPNFSHQIASIQQTTDLYGLITIDVYESNDKNLQYMFCRDSENRAWIGGIEDVSAENEIQSLGLRKSWVNAGDLTTPAYEYSIQAKGYGNTEDKINSYVDMFKNYIQHIPVIKEYLEYKNITPGFRHIVDTKTKLKDAKVILLGENHILRHQNDIVNFINTHADKNDIVLVEGLLANKEQNGNSFLNAKATKIGVKNAEAVKINLFKDTSRVVYGCDNVIANKEQHKISARKREICKLLKEVKDVKDVKESEKLNEEFDKLDVTYSICTQERDQTMKKTIDTMVTKNPNQRIFIIVGENHARNLSDKIVDQKYIALSPTYKITQEEIDDFYTKLANNAR